MTGRSPVHEREVWIERDDRPVGARILTPDDRSAAFPGWILLHGVTRPGIEHPQLLRFARALASSGAVVLVPEVPEWKELRLAPGATLPTLVASIRALRPVREACAGPLGLIGFSFGGPQALIAAADPSVAGEIGVVVSFGGYCDLERTLRFHFTGEHELGGVVERVPSPDPYGRWVVGANYLTVSPGYEAAGAVAQALWELAAAAGAVGAPATWPGYDRLKNRLRVELGDSDRRLFDVFAPPAGAEPDAVEAEDVLRALVSGSQRIDPLIEPSRFLKAVRHPVELLHGRGDSLIPYTESLRMATLLPAGSRGRVTITRLFAHARGERYPFVRMPAEAWTLFATLKRILGAV